MGVAYLDILSVFNDKKKDNLTLIIYSFIMFYYPIQAKQKRLCTAAQCKLQDLKRLKLTFNFDLDRLLEAHKGQDIALT